MHKVIKCRNGRPSSPSSSCVRRVPLESTNCPAVWVTYLANSIDLGACTGGYVDIDGELASFCGLKIVPGFIALLSPSNGSERGWWFVSTISFCSNKGIGALVEHLRFTWWVVSTSVACFHGFKNLGHRLPLLAQARGNPCMEHSFINHNVLVMMIWIVFRLSEFMKEMKRANILLNWQKLMCMHQSFK
jgi:hypothetical protein